MPIEYTVVGVSLLCAVAGGYLAGRASAVRARRQLRRLAELQAETEQKNREQQRELQQVREEQRSITRLARALPDAVRELNRTDLSPQAITGVLVQLVHALFDPDQILVYLAAPTEGPGSPQALFLRAARGLSHIPEPVRTIRVGEGKIGWAAQHRVDMVAEDWRNTTRTEGHPVEDNHPLVRSDMIACILQHGERQEQLLGVICVGRPRLRPRDEKLVLQLVANLGALALMNARHVRELKDQAHHDGLTGLLNRGHFMKNLGFMINSAERAARPLAVFMFDIDHFKAYNDANGHPAGDELLRTMARLLREHLRPGDIACRYGGEEFLVALPDTDALAAAEVAERIREAIAGHRFPHGESQPGGRVTISGGVAALPEDGQNATDLIRHADQALYQAKAGGRNRIVRYRGVEIGDAAFEEGEDFRVYDLPFDGTGP